MFLRPISSIFPAHTRSRIRAATQKVAASLGAGSLVFAGALLAVGLEAPSPAQALPPPFPLRDFINGASTASWERTSWQTGLGTQDPNVFRATTDGWYRIQAGSTASSTSSMLLQTSFPTNLGFTVSFDYRFAKAGGTANPWVGDGFSVFFVDAAEAHAMLGGPRSGLGYSTAPSATGGVRGYAGVSFDGDTGDLASPLGRYGGDASLVGAPLVGVRGSGEALWGNPRATYLTDHQYHWAGGAADPDIMTTPKNDPSSGVDPVTQANSRFRRVEISGHRPGSDPNGPMELVVRISDPVAKGSPVTGMRERLRVNLDDQAMWPYNAAKSPARNDQMSLPATLKLGIGAVAGSGSGSYIDVRNLVLDTATDVAVTGQLMPAKSSSPGEPAGRFLRGADIGFEWTATNKGPSPIDGPSVDPDAIARFRADLTALASVLDLSSATWTCTAAGGAACGTANGTGLDALTDWWAPSGGAVTLRVEGKVASGAAYATYRARAFTPTDFTANTLDMNKSTIQKNGYVADSNLTNNSFEIPFTVAEPALTYTLTASPSTAASFVTGQVVTYTHVIRNTTNAPITSVTLVTDSFDGSGTHNAVNWGTWPSGTPGTLNAGQSVTGTSTYTITAVDKDRNTVTLKAHATGISSSVPVASNPAEVTLRGLVPCVGPNLSGVDITSGQKLANGVDQHIVTVTLKTCDGDPIPGAAASIKPTLRPGASSGATLGPITEVSPGVYEMTLTSTEPGTKTVDVDYQATPNIPLGSASGEFVRPTPDKVVLSASPTTLLVGQTSVATVTTHDASNVPVGGSTIELWSVPPNLIPAGTTVQTSSSGVATLDMSTTVAGTYEVHARLQGASGEATNSPVLVTFNPLPPDLSKTTLTSTTTPTIKAPDGSDWHNAIVTLYDVYGNVASMPADQVAVTLTLQGTGAQVASGYSLTGNTTAGVFTTRIVSTAPVQATVRAVAGGVNVTNGGASQTVLTLPFDWTQPPCSSASWYSLAPTGTRVADGVEAFTITAHLAICPPTGPNVPMTGQAALLGATAIDTLFASDPLYRGTVSAFTATTTAGEYTATITATKAGIKNVAVNWNGSPVTPIAAQAPANRTTVEFVASPIIDFTKSHFDVSDTAGIRPNGSDFQTLTVTLRDANDNPIKGAEGRLTPSSVLLPTSLANQASFGAWDETSPGIYVSRITSSVAGQHKVSVTARQATGTGTDPVPVLNNDIAEFVALGAVYARVEVVGTVPQVVGTGSYIVRVTLLDRVPAPGDPGNPVPGQAVTLSLTGGTGGQPHFVAPGSPSSITGSTGAAGIVEYTVQSTFSGTFPVEVTLPATVTTVVGLPASVTFIAGPVDLTASDIAIEGDASAHRADGNDCFTVVATLRDQYGNPATGQLVRFDVGAPGLLKTGTTQPTDSRSDASGKVRACIAGTDIGTALVGASVDTPTGFQAIRHPSGAPKQVALAFVAGPVDFTRSGFDLPTYATDKVVGTESHLVVVYLRDAGGRPVDLCIDGAGQPVVPCGPTFSIIAGTAVGTGGPATNATVGTFRKALASEVPAGRFTGAEYIAEITSTSAGVKTVIPTYDGDVLRPFVLGGPEQVTFKAGPVVPANSGYVVSTTANVVADGAADHFQTVTVTLRDQYNNPVGGLENDVHAAALPAVVGAFGEVTGQLGVYEAKITSTKSGSHLVTVTYGTPGVAIPATGNNQAVFVAGPPDPARSTLTLDRNSQTVRLPVVATVTLRDAFDNLVGGHDARLCLSPNTVPSFGLAGDPCRIVRTGTTGTDLGVATVSFTTQKADTYQVRATIEATNAQISGSPATVIFTAGAPASATLERTSPAEELIVAGPIPHTAKVVVVDLDGNPVSGAWVVFAAAFGTMTPANGRVQTNADGVATIEVRSNAVGQGLLTATIEGTTIVTVPPSVLLKWVNSVDGQGTYDLTTGTRVVGDPANPHRITVTLTGTTGVPMTGVGASIQIRAVGPGGVEATIGARTETAPGVYVADINTEIAGLYNVTVTFGTTSIGPLVPGRTSVTFVAGPIDLTKSSLRVTDDIKVANGTDTHTATVTLRDRFDNPITGEASVLNRSLEPTDPRATITAFTETATSGVYTALVRSTWAHNFDVVVETPVGKIPAAGNNVTARFGPGIPSAANSKIEVMTPGDKYAGSQFHTVRVTVLDAFNNPVPGATVTITTNPALTIPSNTGPSNANGWFEVTFTSPSPGTFTMLADITGPGSAPLIHPVGHGVVTVRFIPGIPSPANSYFEVSRRANQIADGAADHFQTVSLYLADAAGTPISGLAGLTPDLLTASFIPADPYSGAAPGTPVKFAENPSAGPGWYLATVYSHKSGEFTLPYVTANGSTISVITGGNAIARFVPGPGVPSKSTITVNRTIAPVGETIIATVTTYDQYDNPAMGTRVELWTDPRDPINSTANLSLPADADGKAVFTLMTNKPGRYLLHAGLLLDISAQPVPVSNSGVIWLEWTAGPWSKLTTTLETTTPGNKYADGVDYYEAVVTVRDEHSNLLPDVTVTFELTGPGQVATGYTVTATSGSDGKAVIRYVSNYDLGAASVQARIGTEYVTDNVSANRKTLSWQWIERPPALGNSYFVVPINPVPANGSDVHVIEVVVRDADLRPIVGVASQLWVQAAPIVGSPTQPTGTSFGLAAATHPVAVPGQPGHYTVTMSSTYAATFQITVRLNTDSLVSQPADRSTVTFTALEPYGPNSFYAVSTTPDVRANSVDYQTVTVTLKDRNGNGVPNATPRTVATVNDSELTKSPWIYNVNAGTYTTRLTTSTMGSYPMLAYYTMPGGTETSVSAGTNNTIAVFTSIEPCAANTTFEIRPKVSGEVPPLPVGLGVNDGYELVVTARDCSPSANPVPDVRVEISNTVPMWVPALTDTVKLTGASGQAVFDLKSTKAVAYLVTATIGSGPNQFDKSGPASFKPLAPDPSKTTLTGTDAEQRYNDNVSFHTAIATLRDMYDNPVPGYQVTFSVADIGYEDAAAAIPLDHRSDADGQVMTHIKSAGQTGVSHVSASVAGMGWILNQATGGTKVLNLQFVPKLAGARAYYEVSTGTRVAGDDANPHRVEVRVFDGNGIPMDVPTTQLVGGAEPDAIVSAFTKISDGVYEATITSKVAGLKNVTVLWDGEAASAPSQITTVLFIPGAIASTVFDVTTGTIPANGVDTHKVTVTVQDANGNGVTGLASGLTATAASSTVRLPFAPTAVDGVYEAFITSTVAGEHRVDVLRGTVAATLKAGGNNLARFSALPPSLTVSEVTVTQGPRQVGENHRATVTVTDENGNPIPGQLVTIWTTPEIDRPAAVACSGTSDAQGVVTCDFTSHTPGTFTVWGVLGSSKVAGHVSRSGQVSVVFVPGPPSQQTTTLHGTDDVIKLVNNTTDPHRAWVIVRDAYGNIVTTGATVTFSVSNLTGAALSTTGPVALNTQGRAEVTLTSPTAGTAIVRANVNATVGGTWAVILPADRLNLAFETSIVDPSRSTWSVTSGDRKADGAEFHVITVNLRDATGARVHDVAGQISVTLTPRGGICEDPIIGTWTEGTDPASSWGDYTAQITSTCADIFDVGVTVGAPVQRAASSPSFVSFMRGAPDPSKSSYTVTTGSKKPDGVDFHTVTVTLRDFDNLPVTGAAAKLGQALASPALGTTFTESVTAGQYTAQVTSIYQGVFPVSVNHATIGALTASGNRHAEFLSCCGDPASATLTLTTTNPQVVVTGTHTARVVVVDAGDNPVGNQRVTITAPGLTLPFGGQVTTNASGVATLSFTSAVPGDYVLSARIDRASGGALTAQGSGVVTAQFRAGPISWDKSWMTVTQTPGVVADGVAHQTLTVWLADAAGTGITGMVLSGRLNPSTVTSVPVEARLAWGSFTEDPAKPGLYTTQITSTKSGSFTMSVTLPDGNVNRAIPVKAGDNNVAVFVAGPAVGASLLTASPTTLRVGETSIAQVAVVDAFGNPVPSQPVRFDTDPKGLLVASPGSATIFSDPVTGIAQVPLTTTKAGVYTILADLMGIGTGPIAVTGSGVVTVTFLPLDDPDWSKTILSGTDALTKLVGGVEYHTAQVLVRDRYDNPIPNKDVVFSNAGVGSWRTPASCGTAATCTVRTGSDGIAIVDIVSNVADFAKISAKIGGHDVTNGGSSAAVLSMEFTPGTPVIGNSDFEVTTDIKVVGTTPHVITVTVRDAYGNGVGGQANNLTALADPATGVTVSGFAPAATRGVYTATVAATRAGNKTITVALSGSALSVTAAGRDLARFRAQDEPNLTNSYFEVSQTAGIRANGSDVQTVTVRLFDDFFNPVVGKAAALSAQAVRNVGGVLALVSYFGATATDGVYTAVVTATTVGDYVVTATYRNGSGAVLSLGHVNNSLTPPAILNDIATFTYGTPDPSHSELEVTQGNRTVGGEHQAWVTVRDATDNPVPSVDVEFWTQAVKGGPAIVIANAGVARAGADGVARVVLTTRIADTYRVFAKLVVQNAEVRYSGQKAVTFVAGDPNGFASRLTVPTEGVGPAKVANGSDSHTVRIEVKDTDGNAVPGTAVELTIVAPDGSTRVVTPGALSDANGIVEYTYTTTVAGQHQITGTLLFGGNKLPITAVPNPAIATFVAGPPDPANSRFEVTTDVRVVGGTPHIITATVRDAFGNGVSGQASALAAAPNPAAGVSISSFQATTVVGVYTATVASTSAGTKVITATLGGVNLAVAVADRDKARFTAQEPDTTRSYFEVSTTPNVVADGVAAQTVTVTLMDVHSNPVTGAASQLSALARTAVGNISAAVTAFDPTATDGVYTANVTATTATSYVVTVAFRNASGTDQAIGHVNNNLTPAVTLNDIATFIHGDPDPQASQLDVSTGQVVVGGNHWAEVTVRDAKGNPVPGVVVEFWTVRVGGGPAIVIPAGGQATSGASGTARVTLSTTTAGTYTVFAKLVDLNAEVRYSGQKTVTFIAGDPDGSASRLTVPTEGVAPAKVANGVDQHTIRVEVKDIYGNPVSGIGVELRVVDPSGDVHILTPTALSNSSGVIEHRLSSTLAGAHTVTGVLLFNGSRLAITAVPDPALATFVAGPPSAAHSLLTVSKDIVLAKPGEYTVATVTLRDAFGNLIGASVPGLVVEILTTRGNAGTIVDHGDGTYSAQVSSTTAGNATVSFRLDNVAGTQTRPVLFVEPPPPPPVDFANATTVQGRGRPAHTIKVYDRDDNIVCTTVVKSDGTWRCEGMYPPASHGDPLYVTQTDGYGFESDPTEVIVKATRPRPPNSDPSNGSQLTGDAGADQAGYTIIVRDKDGRELCRTVVQANGRYECRPLTPRPVHGDEVTVVVVDDAENESLPELVIIDNLPPDPPFIEESEGDYFYGTAEPGTTVILKDPLGREICRSRVAADGTWGCTPATRVPDKTKVEGTATDDAGNVSDPAYVVVDWSQVPPPIINPTNGKKVTGKGIPGLKVIVTFPNGAEATADVDANGNWSVDAPPSYTPKNGDVIEAVQEKVFNSHGPKRSPKASVIVDTIAPDAPIVDPTDGTEVTGLGEPGATVIIKDAAGNEIGRALVGPDGRWRARLNPQAKEGDYIHVTQTDEAGNTSPTTTVRVGLIRVVVDRAQLYHLENQVARVYNLQPGETVRLTLGDGLDLGTAIADKDGMAVFTFPIPLSVAEGFHRVQAVGTFSGPAESGFFQVIAIEPTPSVRATSGSPTRTATSTAKPSVSGNAGGAGTGAGANASKGLTGKQAATGAEGLIPSLGAALGAALAGLLLLALARRRREEEI